MLNPKTLPWSGGCRCGQLRFEVIEAPMVTLACHCRGCQQMTGGPYSLSTLFPRTGFKVTAGDPVVGGLHGEFRQMHCAHCLSWVFTEPPGMPMVNVRSTMLDDAAHAAPYVETYTSEMLPWAGTGAPYRFEKFPEDGAWMPIVQEYMAKAAGVG